MTDTLDPGCYAAKAVAWLREQPEGARVDTQTLREAIGMGSGQFLARMQPAIDAGILHQASKARGHKAWWSLVVIDVDEIETEACREELWERRTSAPEIQPRPGLLFPGVDTSRIHALAKGA